VNCTGLIFPSSLYFFKASTRLRCRFSFDGLAS